MIYICIPSYNEAPTVGLVIWKIRRVLEEFPREYQLLVANDASTDATAEVLEPYGKTLPLTVVHHGKRRGYAQALDSLLQLALERTDRPKRDAAIVMHADFAHDPEALPELIRHLDSGADLVVTQASLRGEPSRGLRWLRRSARFLLNGVSIPGSSDVTSGYGAFRLVSLRNAYRANGGRLFTTDGWAANAELFARVAQQARRIDVVHTVERHDLRQRPARVLAWDEAKDLWRYGRRLRIKSPRRREEPKSGNRPTQPTELQEATP
jgi:glycosyltransferase involved in cell wall biosynthesis